MSGRRLAALLAGIASFLAPFWVYLRTLSPTLNFWDCGEFIAAGYTLGIPHPPATPLFVLLVRLASVLPLGVGVAQKANMMSALFGALASLMMFLLVLKLTRHWKWGVRPLPDWVRLAGALCGALFIAFSDTFWLNAIEAEVYALSAFFLGLVLWLVLDWSEHAAVKRGNALVYLILYLLSMGIGLHLGTILVFPGLFVMALMIRTKSFNDLELWLVGATLALFLGSAILHMPDAIMFTGLLAILAAGVAFQARGRPFLLASLGLFALGLSVHLFLLIRAGQSPVMNEADPSNWGNLWAVLKREQYPFQLPTDRKAPLGWQFQHFFGYFWSQFRMPPERQWGVLHLGRALTALPIGLGLLGLWHQFKQEKRHWAATVTVLLVNTIGLVFFLNFSSEEVRERDYFYAAGFYFYALFIGLGAVGLMQTLLEERRGRLLAAVAAPLLVLAAFGPLQHHWYTHDRSENLIARDYAINMLMPLEENAVIFTNGDNDTFPLWYIQEVEGFRKDVRVINLSLLNTDWYMRQLRDDEPRVPIAYTDAEIQEVITHYFRLEDGRIFQPRDEVINHMFVNAQRSPEGWEAHPFYFAVTIPHETLLPYQDYLSMEGLAYRMTLKKGKDQIDYAALRRNLEHVFEWRGVLTEGRSTAGEPWAESPAGTSILERVPAPGDSNLVLPGFYRDETIRHLIQNYAAAWSRLAIAADRGGEGYAPDPSLAVRAMEMASLIREDLGPVVQYLGYLYMKNEQYERALRAYEHYLDIEPQNAQLWARYAQAAEAAGERRLVVQALGRVIELDPDYENAYLSLADFILSYFPSEQNVALVRRELEDYDRRNPGSPLIEERLRLIEEIMSYAPDSGAAVPLAPGGGP